MMPISTTLKAFVTIIVIFHFFLFSQIVAAVTVDAQNVMNQEETTVNEEPNTDGECNIPCDNPSCPNHDKVQINVQNGSDIQTVLVKLSEDQPPLIPLRLLTQLTGANLEWDKDTGAVFYFLPGEAIVFHPSGNVLYLVGKEEDVTGKESLTWQKVIFEHGITQKDGVSLIPASTLNWLAIEGLWDENFRYLDLICDSRYYGNSENYIAKFQAWAMVCEDFTTETQNTPKRLASYSTYFNPDQVNRTINLKLACAAIHDIEVLPGEIFSFNQTVGPRTPQKGYTKAITFLAGQQIYSYGGGVCQVSSTLYNAVQNAGLQTLERYAHSLPVNYVPSEMDATVAYGSKDYRFLNNTDRTILIYCAINKNQLTIEIWQNVKDVSF